MPRHGRVHNAALVGEKSGGNVHQFGQPFQFADVGGIYPAGENRGLAVGLSRFLGEAVHKTQHHVEEAVDVRADIRGGAGVNNLLAFGDGDFRNVRVQIVADGFRKAGRVNGDNLGVVHIEDIFYGGSNVAPAAEYRRAFRKRRRRRQGDFLKVAREQHPVIGSAALRAVAVRHTVMYA